MAKRDPVSTSKEIVAVIADRAESPVAKAILEFVGHIPGSDIPAAPAASVEEECRRLANSAANKAGLTAGSLALPPGPLGWLTVLPELVAIWRIQGQLVSDIAAAHGKTAKLGREQMLWCLFRHTAAQAFRDVAIRVGDRLVFRNAATSVLQRLAGRIGVSVSKRAVGKGISRWLPIVGALGVGAYAYYDTGQVAKTAMELFGEDFHVEGGEPDDSGPVSGKKKSSAGETETVVTAGAATDNEGPSASSKAASAATVKAAVAAERAVSMPAATPKKAAAPRKRATTKRAAPAKRATAKKSVARKVATTKVAKAATKKATKKTAARRAPAKKPAARKNTRTT